MPGSSPYYYPRWLEEDDATRRRRQFSSPSPTNSGRLTSAVLVSGNLGYNSELSNFYYHVFLKYSKSERNLIHFNQFSKLSSQLIENKFGRGGRRN